MSRLFQLCALACFLEAGALGGAISFEDLADAESVGDHYSGVAFENAQIVSSGISLDEFEFPPRSGSKAVVDDGGPMSMVFTESVTRVAAFVTYDTRLMVRAYSGAVLVVELVTAHDSNKARTGDSGSAPNELIEINSKTKITRVVITGAAGGSSFVLDDLMTWEEPMTDFAVNSVAGIQVVPVTVPEPGLGLAVGCLCGVLGFLALRRAP